MTSLKLIIGSIFIIGSIHLNAQQTVGIFTNSEESHDGYTLFAVVPDTNTYLINNCGELCHSWPSDYKPAQAVYMLENGYLLRTGNYNNPNFTAGGRGGIIEMIDWDGNVVWDYIVSTSTVCQHHDIEYLPNGNILVIAWDSYTAAEAEQAGRSISGTRLWSEIILEIEPDLENGGGTVVWEWKAWDHLVQDENPNKDNYGIVGDSPELINLNYVKTNDTIGDWLHFNSIDYNAELDQILLSPRFFSEIWIIDHSTTTEEAASHSGGLYGKGGDIIYRWGNPRTYDQGSEDDQQFFLQHDARWINEGYQDEGMIMIFNNDSGRPIGELSSSVDVIDPPVDESGNYLYSGGAFEPNEIYWSYEGSPTTDFYSQFVSGAERLPNGNKLICEGAYGRLFEIDYEGNIVWEYINPVTGAGILEQGAAVAGNLVFRIERYEPDFVGFVDKDLTSHGYLEEGSENIECDLFTVGILEEENYVNNKIYPNPAKDELYLNSDKKISNIAIYSATGSKVLELFPNQEEIKINVSHLQKGFYVIQFQTSDDEFLTQKFVKE